MNNRSKLITACSITLVVCMLCAVFVEFLTRPDDLVNNTDEHSGLVSRDAVLENDISDDSIEVDDAENSLVSTDYSSVEDETSDAPSFVLNVPEGTVLYSPNILVYSLTDNETVYKNIMYEQCAPASLIKMLTALVALKYLSYDYVLTVGEEIDLIGENSSRAWLIKGKRYKMSTMLDALFLPSGNDAAYTLAVNTARAIADDATLNVNEAVSDFVRLMNEEAKNLGCTFSNFVTPDGYDADGQYTTTEDMLLISIAAYNNPYIKESASKATSGSWSNSNMLIREDSDYYNPCVNGLKTGSTDAAGMCVAVSAIINNKTYIMLFMKGTRSNGRFADANTIISLIEEQTSAENNDELSGVIE